MTLRLGGHAYAIEQTAAASLRAVGAAAVMTARRLTFTTLSTVSSLTSPEAASHGDGIAVASPFAMSTSYSTTTMLC